MKTKNYLLVIFTLISFSISAQVKSTKKKKPKGIIVKNNEIKTNQLVRDFLKNRESKGYKFWRILNGELLIEPYNSSSLQNHSLDRKKNYILQVEKRHILWIILLDKSKLFNEKIIRIASGIVLRDKL